MCMRGDRQMMQKKCKCLNICCLCSVEICSGVTCSGHGTCEAVGGKPKCVCAEGYKGDSCENGMLIICANNGMVDGWKSRRSE